MRNFKKILQEINFALGHIIIFEELLNAALIFLVVYLILSIIDFYPISSWITALLYFAIVLNTRLRSNKAKLVEKKHEPLYEKLRTAADYADVENPIVDELQKEVAQELKNVTISSFFRAKRPSYKIFAAIILCFLIVFASAPALGLKFMEDGKNAKEILGKVQVDLSNAWNKTRTISIGDVEDEAGNELSERGLEELADIYGAESMANLGDEKISVEISPVSYEIDVRNILEAESKVFENTFPDEVCSDYNGCEIAESSKQIIPVEQQGLVRDYFDKIMDK